jgi:hypothetical protein
VSERLRLKPELDPDHKYPREHLGPQELQQYTKLFDKITFQGVRVPLQAALATSPLFLLVPYNLSSSRYPKSCLARVSHR